MNAGHPTERTTVNWKVVLTYADGTSEDMYCTTREEARATRRFYLEQSSRALTGEFAIGTPIVAATVCKS